MSRTVDVAIVGGGTAGMAAYRAAREAGASALLIEARAFGTTCARTGCMPSKLLLAAARAAREARRAHDNGVEAAVRVDGVRVFQHLRAARDAFVAGVLEEIRGFGPEATQRGRARFVAPNVLALDSGEVVAEKGIVVATGAHARMPAMFAALGDRALTDETIFDLATVPASLVVLGAGAIGLELGQAFTRLGSRVIVLDERATLGFLSDAEVEQCARAALGAELDLRLGAHVVDARREGDEVVLTWKDASGRQLEERVERVLVATGRAPALDDMGLDALGLPMHEGKPVIDPHTLQWATAPIFFAGDVNGEHPVLHEAALDGNAAGRNAARFPAIEARPPRPRLAMVFTDPVLAVVGPPASSFDRERVVEGSVAFEQQGRAKIEGRAYGMLRVFADRASGRLLGAEVAAPDGEHLAHWIALALHAELDVARARKAPFYHPTLEEGLQRALRRACHARGDGDTSDAASLDCLR